MHFYSICDITFGSTRVYWKHLNEFKFNLLVQARIKMDLLYLQLSRMVPHWSVWKIRSTQFTK